MISLIMICLIMINPVMITLIMICQIIDRFIANYLFIPEVWGALWSNSIFFVRDWYPKEASSLDMDEESTLLHTLLRSDRGEQFLVDEQ